MRAKKKNPIIRMRNAVFTRTLAVLIIIHTHITLQQVFFDSRNVLGERTRA